MIRPGGLTLDTPRGVGAIELNQGDTKSGRLARADVAALCVESLYYPDLTGETTFECYDADTGAPLATVGLSNIAKKKLIARHSFLVLKGEEVHTKKFLLGCRRMLKRFMCCNYYCYQ
jgi:hypothetical protein